MEPLLVVQLRKMIGQVYLTIEILFIQLAIIQARDKFITG
jgi:hypothetical protein